MILKDDIFFIVYKCMSLINLINWLLGLYFGYFFIVGIVFIGWYLIFKKFIIYCGIYYNDDVIYYIML